MKPKYLETSFKFYLISILVLGLALSTTSQTMANLEPFPERGEQTLSSLTTIETKLTASDATYDDFYGISVAVSGDTVVVGAFLENAINSMHDAAYIYERNQGGPDHWGEVTKLLAHDGAVDDYFGNSVAIDGDLVVVGAYGEDDLGNNSGAAYVFERNQGGLNNWGEVIKLTASDSAEDDGFGYSVSISGDTIVVGAIREDGLGSNCGAAYIFERNQGGPDNWGEVTKLTATDAQDNDYFGNSVAINLDTVIIGAFKESGSGSFRGAAYIFDRNQGDLGNWGEVTKLMASDAENDDKFGLSVAIDGDVVVVGSSGEDGFGSDRGAAYVYLRNQDGVDQWGEVIKLTSSDSEDYDEFGRSVAINGDRIGVGAYFEGFGGSAYLYDRDHGGVNNWGEVTKLTASDNDDYDWFGFSIALQKNIVVAGAPLEDGDDFDCGAAYIFEEQNPHDVYLPIIVRNN